MTRSVFSLILPGAVLAAVYAPPAAFAQGPVNSGRGDRDVSTVSA